MNSRLFSGDDEGGVKIPPKPDKKGPMQTDPTEAGVPSTYDGGFTQAWDTVGTGAIKPALERALLRGACGSAVKLSVSYVGHSAREKSFLFCF